MALFILSGNVVYEKFDTLLFYEEIARKYVYQVEFSFLIIDDHIDELDTFLTDKRRLECNVFLLS